MRDDGDRRVQYLGGHGAVEASSTTKRLSRRRPHAGARAPSDRPSARTSCTGRSLQLTRRAVRRQLDLQRLRSPAWGWRTSCSGRVGALEHGGRRRPPIDQWYIGLYAQDTWRTTDRVTLNAGLRWEPFFGQNIMNGAISQLQPRQLPEGREEHGVQQGAGRARSILATPGFPPGGSGPQQAVDGTSHRASGVAWDVTATAARRCARRTAWRTTSRPPNITTVSASAPPYGNRSLVDDPPGSSTIPTRTSVATRIRSSTAPTPSTFRPARSARSTPTSTRRASSRGTSRSNSSSGRLGRVGQLPGQLLGSALGQMRSIPACYLGPRPLHAATAWRTRSADQRESEQPARAVSGENPAAAKLIGTLDLLRRRRLRRTTGA